MLAKFGRECPPSCFNEVCFGKDQFDPPRGIVAFSWMRWPEFGMIAHDAERQADAAS